jgi:hypothetical protein
MSTKLPYVISEAYPDYKRPSLEQHFGTIDEQLIGTFFVEKAAEFIYERTDMDDHQTVDDIVNFWENYFDEYYMDNSPWDARIFINGKWENVCPSNLEIFECLNRMRTVEKNEEDKKDKEDSEEDSEEELLDWDLSDEEREIQKKMQAYMESELEKQDLELLATMNNTEQIIYILNKCMLNISSDKYKENRELFYKFLSIILRFTEKDIALTTEEMEKNHDDQLSLKLNYLMNIYGSLLEYKNIFHNFAV